MSALPVTIIMIEDDEGHARLIEKKRAPCRRQQTRSCISSTGPAPCSIWRRRNTRPGAASGAARSQPARHERHGYSCAHQANESTKRCAGDRAHHSPMTRPRSSDATIWAATSTIHQAGRVRHLRDGDPPARPLPLRHAGAGGLTAWAPTRRSGCLYIDDDPAFGRPSRAPSLRQGMAVTYAEGGDAGLAQAGAGPLRRRRPRSFHARQGRARGCSGKSAPCRPRRR